MAFSQDTWSTIRADYKQGFSLGTLATKHGVGKTAIHNRSKKEGWKRTNSEHTPLLSFIFQRLCLMLT